MFILLMCGVGAPNFKAQNSDTFTGGIIVTISCERNGGKCWKKRKNGRYGFDCCYWTGAVGNYCTGLSC